MSDRLRILNIGLDRNLLARANPNESQIRQTIYAKALPARIMHLVKAPPDSSSEPFTLADGDIEVHPLPSGGYLRFVLAAVRVGLRLLSTNRIDLIQAQEPFLSGLAGCLLAWRTGIPLVVGAFSDQIDNPAWLGERWLNRIANCLGKFVYRHAAAIRTDSRTVADRLITKGFRQARYVAFLITNSDRLIEPVPVAKEIRSRLLAGRPGPLIITVSRLEPEKNVAMLLKAFRRAETQISGLTMVIIGDGTLRKQLEDVSELLPRGSVQFTGWVPNDQVAAYYQAADLFVLGSNYESSARVLSEALLAGVPVLATDTAGAREVVEEDISGRIVPINDCAAFTQSMIELCDDPGALHNMGGRGRARLKTLVSADAVVGALRNLYIDAVNSRESTSIQSRNR